MQGTTISVVTASLSAFQSDRRTARSVCLEKVVPANRSSTSTATSSTATSSEFANKKLLHVFFLPGYPVPGYAGMTQLRQLGHVTFSAEFDHCIPHTFTHV
eukprot:2978301-Rhodomonas_salina.2